MPIPRFKTLLFLLLALMAELCLLGAERSLAPGHIPKQAGRLQPVGPLAADRQLKLAIGLHRRDQKGLDDFLAEAYNPASPAYRQFLTPEQFTERFGPTEADHAAVLAFLEGKGLKVKTRHRNRLVVDVTGSVA